MLTILASNVCLAFAIAGNKFALFKLPPLLYVAIRMGIPGFLMFLFFTIKNGSHFFLKFIKNSRDLAIIALTTTILPLFLKSFALKNLAATKFAILGGIDPFVASFWNYIFFGETLNTKKLLAVFVAFFAIFISVLAKTSQESLHTLWIFSYPELAALMSVFIAKLGWILMKKLIFNKNFNSGELNSSIMVIAGFITSIWAYFIGDFAYSKELANYPMYIFIPITLIVNTSGYLLFSEALKRYHFTLVSIVSCCIPLLVGVFSYFLFGEIPSLFNLVSGLLLACAVKLFQS